MQFKIELMSRHADWDVTVTVNAESRAQAERLALACMANRDAWLVVPPPPVNYTGRIKPHPIERDD